MNLHEQNKQRNRERILVAADKIIRKEGLEALSMRYLAEIAKVSLRTPYNLFGSKTVILGELFIHILEGLFPSQALAQSEGGIAGLLSFIDDLKSNQSLFDEDLRALYWSMMCAPEQELRDMGFDWIGELIEPLTAKALEDGELKPNTASEQIARQLIVILTAIFGMWAGQQLEFEEVLIQVEKNICAALLCYCNEEWQEELQTRAVN